MRVNLVFPPFALPNNPPLGMAYLKSYTEKNVKNCSINCIDLNLIFHNEFFKNLNKTAFSSSQNPSAINNEILLSLSEDLFKGKREGLFLRKDRYNELANVFFRNISAIHNHYFRICKKYIEEQKYDLNMDFLGKYVDFLLKDNPEVIGFSIMILKQLYPAMVLSKLIKTKNKDIKIVFGGSLFTNGLEEVIIQTKEIDFIIPGEGEKPFSEILINLEEPFKVKGVVYLKNGEIINNGSSDIEDINQIPIADFSDFNLTEYFNPKICIPINTSRGCSWKKCAFCTHYLNYKDCYRIKSVDNIINEIKCHLSKNITYFNFIDDMIPPGRLKQIGDAILKENLKITYYAMAKPTKEFTKEILETIYKSGCRALFWGVESGNQRILDLMNKGINLKDMSIVLKDSSEVGIRNHLFIIVGFPTETIEELNETLNFLYLHREYIDSVHKSKFALNNGSFIFKNPEKYGITKIYDVQVWKTCYNYDVSTGIKETEIDELIQKNGKFFDSFNAYSRFLNIFRDHALFIYSEFGDYFDDLKKCRDIRIGLLD